MRKSVQNEIQNKMEDNYLRSYMITYIEKKLHKPLILIESLTNFAAFDFEIWVHNGYFIH